MADILIKKIKAWIKRNSLQWLNKTKNVCIMEMNDGTQ